jgi:predicted  nucleic acid-binding Zn-ribbon protein
MEHIEKLLYQILDTQKQMQEEVTGIKDTQKQMQEEITGIKDTQKQMQEEITGIKDTQKQMQEEITGIKDTQKQMQEEITEIKTDLKVVFNQTADLTEFRTETRERFNIIDKKLDALKLGQEVLAGEMGKQKLDIEMLKKIPV